MSVDSWIELNDNEFCHLFSCMPAVPVFATANFIGTGSKCNLSALNMVLEVIRNECMKELQVHLKKKPRVTSGVSLNQFYFSKTLLGISI